MDVKQESFDPPDVLIKIEPEIGTDLQTFKKDRDHGELGVAGGHVNLNVMEPEFVVCEDSNIEQPLDSVQNVSINIKQELDDREVKVDITDIKQEVPEYVPIKSEGELLNTYCDLPTLKSENTDYPDYLELPCSSKQGERKSLKDNAKVVSKNKKRRYPCPICRKCKCALN